MDSDDEMPALSGSTLAALQEFALERGIAVDSEEKDFCKGIQKALDTEPREEAFSFAFGPDKTNPEIEIKLKGLRRDIGQTLQSTGLTLWRAGDFLSDYMYENRSMFQDKSVLELGSGLGLCGILASYLTTKQVLITDGDDDTVELLEDNCRMNSVKSHTKCQKLLWGEDLDSNSTTFDIILGADIIYEQEFVEPLFATAAHYLGPDSIFLLAFTRRNVFIDYVLDKATKAGLEWTEPGTDEGIYVFRLRKEAQ